MSDLKPVPAPTFERVGAPSDAAGALGHIEAARSTFEQRVRQLEKRIKTSVRPAALIAQAPRLSVGLALAGGFIAGLLFEAVVSFAAKSQPRPKGNEDER